MESVLILIAIIILGVCIMGGGTAAFCCHGWERGLPFLSIRELYDELGQLDRRTTERYQDFVAVVHKVTNELQKEATNLPNKILMNEAQTVVDGDLEAGGMKSTVECQTEEVDPQIPPQQLIVAPAAEVVISIQEE